MDQDYFNDKNTAYAFSIGGLSSFIVLHTGLLALLIIPTLGVIAHKINKKWPNKTKDSNFQAQN